MAHFLKENWIYERDIDCDNFIISPKVDFERWFQKSEKENQDTKLHFTSKNIQSKKNDIYTFHNDTQAVFEVPWVIPKPINTDCLLFFCPTKFSLDKGEHIWIVFLFSGHESIESEVWNYLGNSLLLVLKPILATFSTISSKTYIAFDYCEEIFSRGLKENIKRSKWKPNDLG